MKKPKLERRMKEKRKFIAIVISINLILVLLIVLFFFKLYGVVKNSEIYEGVHTPLFAGQFYYSDPAKLILQVDDFYKKAEPPILIGKVRAFVLPHAGYVYSGQVAANALYLMPEGTKKVIIIATNHNEKADFHGIAVLNATYFETPLGKIKISKDSKKLSENPLFVYNYEAHQSHIIEVHLPFLQRRLSDFEIIPLVTSYLSDEEIISASHEISKYLDENTILIVSTDLSHYKDYENAVILDRQCIENIISLDHLGIKSSESCGKYALLILSNIAEQNKWQPYLADYKNSGDVSGDKKRVVGYASIFFTESEKKLSYDKKKILLSIARQKLESIYSGDDFDVDKSKLPESIKEKRGCFVTLNKGENLRGCIGHIQPQDELYNCVIKNVENAALRDSRFLPVTEDEIKFLEIEISVLSVPKESSIEEIKFGNGVIIKKGLKQATYLPQVWEQIPLFDDFMSSLCLKANLDKSCSEDRSLSVYTYTADVFSE